MIRRGFASFRWIRRVQNIFISRQLVAPAFERAVVGDAILLGPRGVSRGGGEMLGLTISGRKRDRCCLHSSSG